MVVDARPAVSQETPRVRPIQAPVHDAPGSRSAVAPEPVGAEDGSHEKGGKRHDVPAHHRAAAALGAYVEAAGLEEPSTT